MTQFKDSAAAILGLALAFPGAYCHAVNITPSANVIGQTPEIIGYNSGHFMPGSNTASWWKYSGVNGARVWSTPSVVEAHPSTGSREDDNAWWGDGIGSQQQFLDRRAAVRADPLNTAYFNWPLIETNYQSRETSSNNLLLNHVFGSLRGMGIEPVVEMDRTNSRYFFNPISTVEGWQDRWEQWQHFYAQAFYLAKNFDIQRFQMYNEPNHGSPADVTPTEYLERLQFASDAVQAAVADVNARYGKSLDPQMQGPVTAGGASVYPTWGAPVMQALNTNFLGQGSIKLIDTYAYQQYGDTGPGFASDLTSIKNSVHAAAPGESMRFAITEFNTLTAANFDDTTQTLDTPFQFARLGSIVANLANAQPDELYIQKFSQTSGKKNGVHFVDDADAPYNVGGVTKGGEVIRLFAKGFAGAHELLQKPVAAGSGATQLHLAAAYSSAAGRYSLLSSNVATTAQTLNLDLSSWGLQPGAYVTVEEVSSERHGEVRELVQVPASGLISLNQPAESVLLFSAPQSAPAYRITLGATDDAMVKAGGNANSNYGSSANLYAKNDATNAAARNVTFMKFDMGAIAADAVEQAILRVHGENEGTSATVITHIYGMLGDNWNEQTITWNNAPNLKYSLGTVNDISHNFVEGVGATAEIVGHFTGTQTARELMFDVTPFVQSHPDQQITFLIAREVRFDGENVDDALTSLRLDSKESGVDPGPQLILSLNSSALPADFNGDGVVDGNDLAAWTAGIGEGASQRAGDADGDGDADGSDFLQWQQSLGLQVTTNLAVVATAVPEPFAAQLGLHAAYCVALLHRVFIGPVR